MVAGTKTHNGSTTTHTNLGNDAIYDVNTEMVRDDDHRGKWSPSTGVHLNKDDGTIKHMMFLEEVMHRVVAKAPIKTVPARMMHLMTKKKVVKSCYLVYYILVCPCTKANRSRGLSGTNTRQPSQSNVEALVFKEEPVK